MNRLSRPFTVLERQPFSTANRENSGGAARNVRETKRGGDDAKPNDPEPNTSVRRCANTMDRDHNKGDHRFLPLDWPPALAQGQDRRPSPGKSQSPPKPERTLRTRS